MAWSIACSEFLNTRVDEPLLLEKNPSPPLRMGEC